MMRPSADSRSWVLVLVVVQVLVLAPLTTGYNLDLEHSLDFNGPSSSMFGYSVVFHTKGANKWLIVGAPEANSSSKPFVHSPGALYRCQIKAENRNCYPIEADVRECGKTCEAESDHQWLGVSLSRQPGPTGERILACAHRWKNVYHAHRDGHNNKLPHGVCFIYGSDLMFPRILIPCYRDHQRKFGVDYASCQAGMSSFQTKDLIIIGAPGTSYWTGSVMVFSMSGGTSAVYLDESEAVGFGSYLGYSVGAGQFLGPDSVEAVGGAPQANQKGKVFIFSVVRDTLQIISVVSGTELGAYFGSSVCAVDLNADGLSDLLVGAPMTTGGVREEGRVHVYINQGEAKLVEAEFQLSGRDAYAARFGESIADLGDLDDDGYPDVAIGAPHEDDLKGAVYIYNGREDGISPTPSQRITGSTLGRDLRMFGQSLSSGIDIDNNGYWDVAVGAFLSDSAVVLRTRPVIQVEASLILPEKIDQKVALCRQHRTPTVCFNVTVCFSVWSRSFSGDVDLQYNLTSDLLHKPSFPNRFYFHGNGSSNSTRGRVRARLGQVTCATHVAYQKKDMTDIFTPVQFEVSYSHREASTHRSSSRHFPPLKPILHQSSRDKKTITNQTRFYRSCSEVNCSTNMQLTAELVLPHQQNFITVGSGETILLKTSLLNSGDDAFLPKMTLQFPENIHFVKVLHDEDHSISCAVTQEENSTSVDVDCGVTNLLPSASPRMNISFLLDVSQNSTAGDNFIHINTSSDNYEREEYLQDNSLSLLLPLKYLVNLNIRGSVTPTSFLFGDEDLTPVDCYPERFNYTYKVLNSGPSRSVDTVVEITLPKILTPYKHRLLKVFNWQSSLGVCSLSNSTVSVHEDCEVPEASYIKQIVFFFSETSHRRMFCGRGDDLCERLVCRLGNLEAGREASIQLEVKLNPAVLLQAPGRHGIMKLESTAWRSNPREGPYTILVKQQAATATVLVEALFTQKPSTAVKVFIIVISLVLGLMILAALIWCLWKAGFFKRNNQKEEEEFKRDSWDYVPKNDKRESTS